MLKPGPYEELRPSFDPRIPFAQAEGAVSFQAVCGRDGAVQVTLSEKLEALTETLGIMFAGSGVTLGTDGDYWTFSIDSKALRFAGDFLNSHDVDHILTLCHAAISELKARPTVATINIGARGFKKSREKPMSRDILP